MDGSTGTAFDFDERLDIKLNLMSRRRYRWDIYCERLFEKQHRAFFEVMSQIRPYFYPLEQIMEF